MRVEGSSKKEKGLMDMDNSLVIMGRREVGGGGRGYKADNGNGKNTIKIHFKICLNIRIIKVENIF